jgi:hypothetical protein
VKDVLDKLRATIRAMEPEKSDRCGCKMGPIKTVTEHCGGHGYASDKDLEWVYHTLLSVEQDLERLSSDV